MDEVMQASVFTPLGSKEVVGHARTVAGSIYGSWNMAVDATVDCSVRRHRCFREREASKVVRCSIPCSFAKRIRRNASLSRER